MEPFTAKIATEHCAGIFKYRHRNLQMYCLTL